jgi:phosphonoacetate hydrolase
MPHPALRRAVAALTAPELAPVVDLVAWVEDGRSGQVACVANHLGEARLGPGGAAQVVSGVNPLGSQDPMAFLPYEREVAGPSPASSLENAYPYAAERLLSLFADPSRSPDLAVVHTPRHFFPDEGGHAGEHGSLDVVQSRAPLLLAGAGVRHLGLVDEHAHLVDVGPTLAALAGVPEAELVDAAGNRLDGRVLHAYLDPQERPRAVVGILWDGAPSGDLLHLAETGALPHVARLLERGTALRGGAVAQFPSVTLTNHTSILTGLGPGRHGVLGNVFYDRASGERVVPNDETTWHRSAEWLRPAARTVFEMVSSSPNTVAQQGVPRTASVDEAIDRGADYSTMQLIRDSDSDSGNGTGAGGLGDRLPPAADSPFLGNPGDRSFLDDAYFRWGVSVDDLGLAQMRQLFTDPAALPRLTWWANVVTDAGHHGAGPRSAMARDALRQSDARLGVFMAHLEQLGVLDEVAFVLTADHGFEGADPAVTGSWRPALESLGVPFRDEGPGFVYLM